jgi:hypothetical protein
MTTTTPITSTHRQGAAAAAAAAMQPAIRVGFSHRRRYPSLQPYLQSHSVAI